MNIFDIIVGIVLVWSVFRGWKSGLLVQLSGIAGIILGTWVAFRFSDRIAQWLNMESVPAWVTFAIVLVAVMAGVIVVCSMITRLLKAGGLALPFRILGAVFAFAKGLLILSLLLLALEWIGPWTDYRKWTINQRAEQSELAEEAEITPGWEQKIKDAKSYPMLKSVGEFVFPYLAESSKILIDSFKAGEVPATDSLFQAVESVIFPSGIPDSLEVREAPLSDSL